MADEPEKIKVKSVEFGLLALLHAEQGGRTRVDPKDREVLITDTTGRKLVVRTDD